MQIPQKTLAVVLLDRHATCFVGGDQSSWRHEGLHGEAWLPLSGNAGLETVLRELDDRMHYSDGLARFTLHLIYDQATRSALASVAATLEAVQCKHWQVLQWELLCDRAAALTGSAASLPRPALDWLRQGILPMLDVVFGHAADVRVAEQAHADSVARLTADRMRLEAEIALQREQMATLQRPALDDVVTYMPALYRNVFSSIAPHDLALLAGSLQVPQIASPWPEPAPDTLQALQSRLRRLPQQRAAQIREFCRSLPHRLEMRAEMRAWLGQD
jgi:hypothetical protein